MLSSLAAFAVAAAVAIALTPGVRRLALSAGAIDAPGGRRVHGRRIPRLGGLSVVLAFFAPLVALFALESEVSNLVFDDPLRVIGLFGGGCLVAAIGAVDDVRGVRAIHKLWVHVAAALIAFACGFRIEVVTLPFGGNLELGFFSAPFTVLWIVGIVNALNLIDGLDGLAGGIAFFACVTNFTVAALHGNVLVMLLSAALGGAILGFLLYNFNPASIFMGDSGSMFLGFVLATTSMLGASIKSSTTVALVVPIIALGVPIVDTLFAMVRRVLERRPIFSPDRGHIHHRLLEHGITHRRAVLILYAVSIVFTASAIAVAIGRSWQVGGALLVMTVVLIGIVRFVGYFEYLFLRRRQKMLFRSRTTERLRKAVPTLIRSLAAQPSPDGIRGLLEEFAGGADLLGFDVLGSSGAFAFEWAPADVLSGRHSLEMVTASYPLRSLGAEAQVRFAWTSEDGDVSPQADILLQLVADALDAALAPHVLSLPVPAAEAERSTAAPAAAPAVVRS